MNIKEMAWERAKSEEEFNEQFEQLMERNEDDKWSINF